MMMTIKKLNFLCIAVALLALPGLSVAHPEHDEEPPKLPAAQLQAELLSTKTGATILVTREGKAVSTAGASGTLTLLDGDKKTDLALKPVRRNVMTANNPTAIGKGTRAQVIINFADKATLSKELVAK